MLPNQSLTQNDLVVWGRLSGIKKVPLADGRCRGDRPIDAVMAAQVDLVEGAHTLKQVVCVKGWGWALRRFCPYTERNCFPYRRRVRLKPAAPLAGKWRFEGGFPYT